MTQDNAASDLDDTEDELQGYPPQLFARNPYLPVAGEPSVYDREPFSAAPAPVPMPSRKARRLTAKQRPESLLRIGRDRLDPYYDGIWTTDPHGLTWTDASRLRARQEAGLVKVPPGSIYGTLVDDARDRMRRKWDLEEKIAYLAALQAYRTLTGEQLAAITGIDVNSKSGRRALSDLFALGAISIGSPITIGTPVRTDHGAHVYRLHSALALKKEVGQYLTAEQQRQILGDRDWQAGSADRHDMLAAELLLRVAHSPLVRDVWTVLPERRSRIFDVAIDRFGLRRPLRLTDRAADATLVLSNGATVFVELTASKTTGLAAKLENYARLLSNFSERDNGAVLLVLVAPDPFHGDITADIEQALVAAFRKHAGTLTNVVADRMLIAEWADWFPERHFASEDFLDLRARRVNPRTRAMAWETVELTKVIQERHPHLTASATGLATAPEGRLYLPVALRAHLEDPGRYDGPMPMPVFVRRPTSTPPAAPPPAVPEPRPPAPAEPELLPMPGGAPLRGRTAEEWQAIREEDQPWLRRHSAPESPRRTHGPGSPEPDDEADESESEVA